MTRNEYKDMTVNSKFVADIRETIIKEIVYALGFPRDGWLRRFIGPVFYSPANKFAKIIAQFDHNVEEFGVSVAAGELVKPFVETTSAYGIENIPVEGPLVIASNHPGAYDGFVTVSYLPRQDVKVVVSGVPFFMNLPSSSNHLIFTSVDAHERMRSVREILRHLKNGGALLIFPSGKVDPDPAFLPGVEQALESWSPSLELVLKKVPQTNILPAIVSDVLSPDWLRNPITKIPSEGWRQQKLAEFFQIMQQLFFPKSIQLSPKVAFGQAVNYSELAELGSGTNLMPAIINQAKLLYRSRFNAIE
jgi:hypothetical protein